MLIPVWIALGLSSIAHGWVEPDFGGPKPAEVYFSLFLPKANKEFPPPPASKDLLHVGPNKPFNIYDFISDSLNPDSYDMCQECMSDRDDMDMLLSELFQPPFFGPKKPVEKKTTIIVPFKTPHLPMSSLKTSFLDDLIRSFPMTDVKDFPKKSKRKDPVNLDDSIFKRLTKDPPKQQQQHHLKKVAIVPNSFPKHKTEVVILPQTNNSTPIKEDPVICFLKQKAADAGSLFKLPFQNDLMEDAPSKPKGLERSLEHSSLFKIPLRTEKHFFFVDSSGPVESKAMNNFTSKFSWPPYLIYLSLGGILVIISGLLICFIIAPFGVKKGSDLKNTRFYHVIERI